MVNVRIRFGVWLTSGYAHIGLFVLLSACLCWKCR